ncbi:type I methionyl aminopeptidase [Sulfurospirillum arcachonense]|uniref:type I methionyl aminopeptidase n=1 Tax=Sulfurospirillum arcachonense TaxID=57666 RepID=UPI00046A844E|nr:type I methionyl aminopeptidase [Sulfurospirillum arcachonense]
MAIAIRKPQDIECLRISNKMVAQTLELLSQNARPGMTLLELNEMGEEFIRANGGRPAFKGLYGFPAGVCTSVNEVIIHGIPNNYTLKDGDIVGFDIGVEKNGWYGDAAVSVGIGEISKENQDLIDCSRDTLYHAIENIKVGMRFKELSLVLEEFIHSRGFVPLRSFCGHGIGRKPHEEPEIPNYLEGPNAKQGPKIKNGMVFCLEPMICQKSGTAKILEDKWSVVSEDGLFGSHYEHTVAIVNNRAEILSAV